MTSTLDEDILPTMIGVLEGGIEIAHQGRFLLSSTILGKLSRLQQRHTPLIPNCAWKNFLCK